MLDTTSPIWIVAPLDATTEIGEVFVQRLGAWDESGIDHWWLNSTSHFSIDENGVIRNTTLLEAGIYNLKVRVYDPYGAYCSASLVITVLDTSTPTTTTPTTTTTTTVEGIDPLVTLVLGAGIGGISVLVVIFIFLKRKP